MHDDCRQESKRWAKSGWRWTLPPAKLEMANLAAAQIRETRRSIWTRVGEIDRVRESFNGEKSGRNLHPRNLSDTPTSTKCLDQEHAGSHALGGDVHGGAFVVECRAFGGGHFQIAGDASLVARI